jgi:hypothetical protein
MHFERNAGNNGKTLVYNHFLEKGNAKQISRGVQEYLLTSRIKNVVTGECVRRAHAAAGYQRLMLA